MMEFKIRTNEKMRCVVGSGTESYHAGLKALAVPEPCDCTKNVSGVPGIPKSNATLLN